MGFDTRSFSGRPRLLGLSILRDADVVSRYVADVLLELNGYLSDSVFAARFLQHETLTIKLPI